MPLIFLLLISSCLSAVDEVTLTPKLIAITLEHAISEAELQFGLMSRSSLEENEGMTFNYPQKKFLSCWMFNCFIDLSVAFIDERHVIREIYEMKAHPELMDPKRVVRSPSDFSLYPIQDPVTQVFMKETTTSRFPSKYALEMNKGWFRKNGVEKYDIALWDTRKKEGMILKTIDLTPLISDKNLKISFSPPSQLSLMISKKEIIEVTLFGLNGEKERQTLIPNNPIYTKFPVTYCLISKQKKDIL